MKGRSFVQGKNGEVCELNQKSICLYICVCVYFCKFTFFFLKYKSRKRRKAHTHVFGVVIVTLSACKRFLQVMGPDHPGSFSVNIIRLSGKSYGNYFCFCCCLNKRICFSRLLLSHSVFADCCLTIKQSWANKFWLI